MTRHPQTHQGFFVFIPVVFLIIVAIVVAAMNVLMSKVQQTAATAMRAQIDEAYQAVIGFAATHKRLPSTAEFANLVEHLKDAYGQPVVYLHDNAYINATPDICSRSTTVLRINNCATSQTCATPVTTDNVAFAVMSGGEIRGGGANPISQSFGSGISQGLTGASTINVYTAGLMVGDIATPTTNPFAYDDEIHFADVKTLRQLAGCQGGQVRIINNELPRGTTGQPYNATLFADGGVLCGQAYRWCIDGGNLPPGISASPNSPTPLAAGNCAAEIWNLGNSLALSGTPTAAAGTYALTYYVKDYNSYPGCGTTDSSISKKLSIVISAGSIGGSAPYTEVFPGMPPGGTGDTGQTSVALPDGTVVSVSNTTGAVPTLYLSSTGIGVNSDSGPNSLNLGQGEQMSFTFSNGQKSLAVFVGMLKNNDLGYITFLNNAAVVGTVTLNGCSSADTSLFNNLAPSGNPTFNQVILTSGTHNGYYINQVRACATTTCAITGSSTAGAATCTSWTSP